MGPCPSNKLLTCWFTTSYLNWWPAIDQQLVLPPLGGESDTITISGWSGGGYTSNNFYVAYSDYIKGVGMMESGTYGQNPFFMKESLNPAIELANKLADEGRIAPTSNIKDDPVFIFSALDDPTVPFEQQLYQQAFYEHYGAKVEFVQMDGIGHTLPSIFEQSTNLGPQNGAQYDLAGNLLKYLLTNLKDGAIPESDWAPGDTDWRNKGVFKKFYQYEFLDTYFFEHHGLDEFGYIYYPNKCYDGSEDCKVHMYIHGCGETVDSPWFSWTEVFYKGYFEYAASNNIILLMPQTQGTWLNPFECFDVFNYNTGWWSSDYYVSQKGVQISAFVKMLERVTESRSVDYNYGARNIANLDDFNLMLFNMWRSWLAFPGWIDIMVWSIIQGSFFWLLSLFVE